MIILAIDIGEKNVGIAISKSAIIANEYSTLKNDSEINLILSIKNIIQKEQVDKIVIGFPKNMDGTSNGYAKRVVDFTNNLKQKINIPVILEDERLTTQESYRQLKAQGLSDDEVKKRVDQFSAKLILEQYLSFVNSEK